MHSVSVFVPHVPACGLVNKPRLLSGAKTKRLAPSLRQQKLVLVSMALQIESNEDPVFVNLVFNVVIDVSAAVILVSREVTRYNKK